MAEDKRIAGASQGEAEVGTDASAYAKHLRTIQSLVLVTSVALILTGLESPTGKVARARADAVGILRLAQTWDASHMTAWLDERLPSEWSQTVRTSAGGRTLTVSPAFYENRVRRLSTSQTATTSPNRIAPPIIEPQRPPVPTEPMTCRSLAAVPAIAFGFCRK